MWWAVIMWWVGTMAIPGLVIEITRRGVGSNNCIRFIITRSEGGLIAMQGLAAIISLIGLFGSIDIVVLLEIFFEVFQGLGIKVMITMIYLIIYVFLREGKEEQDLGFCIVKFLFITTIQELNSL